MTDTATTRSVVIEREMPHPPEKVWRALTRRRPLIGQWLMRLHAAPSALHFGLDRLDCRRESHHPKAGSLGCGRGGGHVLEQSVRPGFDLWRRAMVRRRR
jgi:hypothetical protein